MTKTITKVRAPLVRSLLLLILLLVSAGAWAQGSGSGKPFDHHNTGFPLEGAHAFVPCQSCHVDGEFKGTPNNCVDCHSPNARFNATFKPVTHITSTDQCAACHRPTFWEDVVRTDHMQVMGPCIQCHNRIQATGQPPGHIPTTVQCAGCHSDLSWIPVDRVDHDFVVGTCRSCHNDFVAPGQPEGHIETGPTECNVCHQSTVNWADVQLPFRIGEF